MKTINLKKSVISVDGQKIELRTEELIRIAVNKLPEGGIDIPEMINRQRILDNIDSISEDTTSINFNTSDLTNLKRYVAASKWGVVSKFIIDFNNDLL